MYLEFIATVTEDILSRGHVSNRFFFYEPPDIYKLVLHSVLNYIFTDWIHPALLNYLFQL